MLRMFCNLFHNLKNSPSPGHMEAPPLALLSINAETAGSLKMRVSYTWRSICITESIVVASRAKKSVNFLNLIVYVWFCTHTFVVDDKYRACSHDKWRRKYYVCIPASSVAPPITPPSPQLLPPHTSLWRAIALATSTPCLSHLSA